MQLAVIDHNVYIRKYKEAKEPEVIRNKNTANHIKMDCTSSKRKKGIFLLNQVRLVS